MRGWGLVQFSLGEEILKQSAGVYETHDYNVSGVGDIVAEQQPHDA